MEITLSKEMCLRALATIWKRFQECVDNNGNQLKIL